MLAIIKVSISKRSLKLSVLTCMHYRKTDKAEISHTVFSTQCGIFDTIEIESTQKVLLLAATFAIKYL